MDYYSKVVTRQLRMLKDSFKKVAHLLSKKQKRTYTISIIFMFLSSLLELFTIGLLVPFLGMIISPASWMHYTWIASFLSPFRSLSFPDLILILGIVLFSLFIVKNGISYFLYSYYNRFVYSLATELAENKLRHYYSLPFLDYQKSNTAEILREISSLPIEFAHHIILGSMIILSESMVLTLFAAGMVVLQFRMFLMMISILLPFVFLAWYASGRFLRKAKETIQQKSPENFSTLSDALFVFQETKLYNKEKYFSDRYVIGQRDLNLQLGKLNAANAIPSKLSEIFAIAGILLILFFYYSFEGQLTISVVSLLTMFVAFAYRAIPSINKILNAAVHMRTYSFTIDAMPTAQGADIQISQPDDGLYSPLQFIKAIDLRHITFSYPQRRKAVLDNLTLHIAKGEIIGLVGHSGSGKTTLMRVLVQLIKQYSGTLMLDGNELHPADIHSWNRLFAYVTQDSFILSDTVEANIAFGIPKFSIDTERVHEVLQRVGLADFVSKLPDGIYTRVGEHGKNISGGQKQRFIIARALYRNAEIFIFDEAMSAVDSVSVQEVLRTLSSLHREGKTIIIVSHHQNSVSLCTKIYSLKQGKLQVIPHPHTTKKRGIMK
ncbi:MAG: ABC transporter ATP-binding protein [Bacteroidota bacterium]|jgi:ABC-type bacteriocin/lantibiotic exporter with double-glycine peptidase domain